MLSRSKHTLGTVKTLDLELFAFLPFLEPSEIFIERPFGQLTGGICSMQAQLSNEPLSVYSIDLCPKFEIAKDGQFRDFQGCDSQFSARPAKHSSYTPETFLYGF